MRRFLQISSASPQVLLRYKSLPHRADDRFRRAPEFDALSPLTDLKVIDFVAELHRYYQPTSLRQDQDKDVVSGVRV